MNTQAEMQKLAEELDALEAAADEFSLVMTRDGAWRAAYKRSVHELAETIFASVKRGEMTAWAGAQRASTLRNTIMAAVRQQTSVLGRSVAEYYKEHGKSTQELLEHYAQKAHRKRFNSLSSFQRKDVYLEVIRSSGRTNSALDNGIAKVARLGQGVLALSLVFSVKHVLESKHKADAFFDEAATFLSGIVGGEAGALAVRLIVGPGAPIFVGAGMFLGSFITADSAHNYIKTHFDLSD